MYTSLCIARLFDDHRSCQKLINYITNIKAKTSVKEQAFNFMWDGINWKKEVNILLTNNR
jgi:hypothetical protein